METANLALAASALLAAAEARAESRGCHVRTDHPDRLPSWERSVLVRQVDGAIDTEVAESATGRRMGLTEQTRLAIADAGLVAGPRSRPSSTGRWPRTCGTARTSPRCRPCPPTS